MENTNLPNGEQTPVDLPTAQAPEQPQITLPQVAPPATEIRMTGFLSAKVMVTLAAVVVIGGGVAFGYFVFPEPFYNTVGKYLGLPAPTEDLRPVADDVDFGVVLTEEETENTEADATAPESDVNIFDVIPGEDANFLLSFKVDEKTMKIVQDLLKTGTSTFSIPEENLDLVKSVSQLVFAAKFTSNKPRNIGEKWRRDEFPMVLGIKTTPEFEQKLLEQIKISTAAHTEYQYDVSSFGNGIIIAKTANYELSGKFSDNPMFGTIESADADFVIAGDLSDFANQAAEEESNTAPEKLAKNPIRMKQLVLQKKMKSGAVLADFIEEAGKNNLELNVNIQMEDSTSASELVTFLIPLTDQLKMFIPLYQSFVEFKLSAEDKITTINIMIKDLSALEEKINETMKVNLRGGEYSPMPSLNTDENTGELTETRDVPPAAAPSDARVKVPRVKTQ